MLDYIAVTPASTLSNRLASPKIQSHHLDRNAVLYIRQSTAQQLRENQESTARQYQLVHRLHALGWREDQVIVIDEDLGISGSGHAKRGGFRRLIKLVTDQEVGIVLGLEMSRLARNSKDWSDLFEVCAIFDSIIADEDGVFQPNDPNDRLVLGLKGIISEMELHTMRIRLERGRMNKAERGELFHDMPVGFVRDEKGMPRLDPDESARFAIETFFRLFESLGSAHALFLYSVEHQFKLPYRCGIDNKIDWRIPSKTHVYETLKHPLYAGTYSYGKRKNYKRVGKTPQKKHLPPEQWKVKLLDRFPRYITWQQYLDNQKRLYDNCTNRDRKGPPRSGAALVAGIVFCNCGRRMTVGYNTDHSGGYYCNRHQTIAGVSSCRCTITCQALDEFVIEKTLQALEPAAIELSIRAVEDESVRRQQLEKQFEHRLQRAQYEADLTSRRYQSVDPSNRLVAATLEKQWETGLTDLQTAQQEIDNFRSQCSIQISDQERTTILATCNDIRSLWINLGTQVDRKEIIRLMLESVVVSIHENQQRALITLRWSGGYESCHEITRPVSSYEQLDCYEEMIDRALQLTLTGVRFPKVASILNAEGFRTPRNREPLSGCMVGKILNENTRSKKQLTAPELEKDQWLAPTLAKRLGMREKLLKDWVTRGWAHATQRPFGKAWVIWANEAELQRLEALVASQTGQGARMPAKELLESTFKSREKR
jgi:DNA invertase Pin-like site-specific DNA recombinase